MKLELILMEEPDKIKALWFSYHNVKPGIVPSVLSDVEHDLLVKRNSTCPLNLYPIYRNSGFFLLLSQYQDANHVVFCNMEDYKRDPHSAMPWLVITMYTELHKSKKVVLLRGDITNKNLQKDEAIRILKLWKLMYLDQSGEFFMHVQKLNQTPGEFDIERFLKAIPKDIDSAMPATKLEQETSQSVSDAPLILTQDPRKDPKIVAERRKRRILDNISSEMR